MSDFKKAEQLSKKNKAEFVDDGRSITNMNVEGFSWYRPEQYTSEQNKMSDMNLTWKERFAMIVGALRAILPIAGMMAVLYFGAFLLISLWLK